VSREDRILWDERWAAGTHGDRVVSAFLEALDGTLPRAGTALDVAGGIGLSALWLARRGLDTTLLDVSPVALRTARGAAEKERLPLRTLERDLEVAGLPDEAFDVVTCFHYLHRPLFRAWPKVLRPGGVLVFEHPTRTNLERHPRPPERFLLEDRELGRLVHGLDVLSLSEGWDESGRHQARLLARRAAR
jgi:tellurite methyltransferase